MQIDRWMKMAAFGLSFVACTAWADGLIANPGPTAWPQWQGRLSLSTGLINSQSPAARIGGHGLEVRQASVFGDYYFTRSIAPTGRASGFRATSGLVFGPATRLGLTASLIPAGAASFSAQRSSSSMGLAVSTRPDGSVERTTVPYVGIGYTDVSPKGGWGFSADFGLVGGNRSPIKFGQALGGLQNLDDVLRDMRLSPLLQLGVSYSF